jgi:DNA-directed RNA polymerase specialized sigma24 family protein
LLTADHSKAEQCFDQAIDDSLQDDRVFLERAYSWARRAIIKSAIKIVSPRLDRVDLVSAEPSRSARPIENSGELVRAITALAAFDRFVYVMSVLEGLVARDCCILLKCTAAEFNNARVRALQRLANVSLPVTQPGFASQVRIEGQ